MGGYAEEICGKRITRTVPMQHRAIPFRVGYVYGKKIIITNGFIKKTQETPKREIELAKSYRKDYLERVNRI